MRWGVFYEKKTKHSDFNNHDYINNLHIRREPL